MKTKKIPGFTLIELLIVIAIIGILAVAFLPTLLGAPAKGRDTQRITDMQKIQKVLVNAGLEGKSYPTENFSGAAISPTLTLGGAATGYPPSSTWGTAFASDFGGAIPADPQGTYPYRYFYAPGSYSFAVQAKMETIKAGNAICDAPYTAFTALGTLGTPTSVAASCYIVLSK